MKRWVFAVDSDGAITGFVTNSRNLTVKQMRERRIDLSTAQVEALRAVEEQYHIVYGGGGDSMKRILLGPALGEQFHDDRPSPPMDIVEIQAVIRTNEGWRLDVKSHAVKVKPGPGLIEFYEANDTGSIYLTPGFELIVPKR